MRLKLELLFPHDAYSEFAYNLGGQITWEMNLDGRLNSTVSNPAIL
ncbi:MAG: hypothetical protein GY874_00540 [Desulfobacteraceae bacterium]|nr:hypothetical protein [Desulfobacteraceae bacterium]